MYILKESEYSLPVYTSNDNDRRKNDLSQNLVIIITAKKLFSYVSRLNFWRQIYIITDNY